MADKKIKKEGAEKKEKSSKKETAPEKEIRIKARLREEYKNDIVPSLMKKFGYKSVMQVPKLDKIVVNMGVGAAVADPKIGAMVTLRKERMYEFLDRLVNIALPRVRDFRGLSDKSFDGRGNYTLGVKEQIIFPEINVEKITKVMGMDVTFVTTAKSDAEAFDLLSAFGVPFAKKEIKTA